jgi:hypothetical protein
MRRRDLVRDVQSGVVCGRAVSWILILIMCVNAFRERDADEIRVYCDTSIAIGLDIAIGSGVQRLTATLLSQR